jgi:hypothetical protein
VGDVYPAALRVVLLAVRQRRRECLERGVAASRARSVRAPASSGE